MTNLNNICVIFDMDGTLADTSQITVPAMVRAAADMGLPPPNEARVKQAIGINGPGFYAAIYPDETAETLARFSPLVEVYERQLTAEMGEALLFPGIKELLDGIIQAGGLCALASTGDVLHVNSVLKNTGIFNRFSALEWGDNDKAGEVARVMAALPGRRYVMVGDKPKDSGAARANGLKSIGVGYGFSSQEELTGFDAVAGCAVEVGQLIVILMQN